MSLITQRPTLVSVVTAPGLVATRPLEVMAVKAKVEKGFGTVEQKVGLAELEVVLQTSDGLVRPGDTVLVRGEAIVKPWAKAVYDLDGVGKYILVPESEVYVIRFKAPEVA